MKNKLITQPLAWHAQAWSQLQAQILSGETAHAYLISGEADSGKRQFATLLAQRILCRTPLAGAACGHCTACRLNAAGNNPDLHLLIPEDKSKIIKIDQVRELKKYIETSSHAFGKRIVILDAAENLNINAANALLKSLEEPPPDVMILVLSDRPKFVLPTISSRCAALKLPPPSEEQSLVWLSEQLPGSEREALEFALDYAQGRPFAALGIVGTDEDKQALNNALLKILQQQELATKVAGRYYKTHAKELLETLAYWLSALAKFHVTGKQQMLKGTLLQEAARALNSSIQDQGQLVRGLLNLYQRVCESQSQLAGGANPNMQLMLEDLLLQLQGLSSREARH